MIILPAWGNTYSTRLQPIRKLQKKIKRIQYTNTSPLFKELSILPLDDINNEVIALLIMCRYFHNMLPSSFNNFFSLNKLDIHKYNFILKRIRSSSNVHKIQHPLIAKNT